MSKNSKLDTACEHLARIQSMSSMSTRIQEVGQGVAKKGAEFQIWRQTDF